MLKESTARSAEDLDVVQTTGTTLRWQSIFDTISDPIFVHDSEFLVVRCNLAYISAAGKPAEEILGKPYWQSFPKGDGPLEACLVALRRHSSVEAEILVQDDVEKYFLSRSFPFYDANNDYSYSVHILTDITAQKAMKAERDVILKRLNGALYGTISAISRTIEYRDPYTAGHQARVAALSVAIAEELKLPEEQVEGIRIGALIHDIGKISIPGEIITYPGKLSAPQFAMIKEHSTNGYNIVKDIEFPFPIAEMIYQHHERLDGSGYPRGLKGDQILLEAQILMVADIVEAITSHRPYRAALGIDVALKEIEAHRGTWLNPDAVEACIRLFRVKEFAF